MGNVHINIGNHRSCRAPEECALWIEYRPLLTFAKQRPVDVTFVLHMRVRGLYRFIAGEAPAHAAQW